MCLFTLSLLDLSDILTSISVTVVIPRLLIEAALVRRADTVAAETVTLPKCRLSNPLQRLQLINDIKGCSKSNLSLTELQYQIRRSSSPRSVPTHVSPITQESYANSDCTDSISGCRTPSCTVIGQAR